MVDLVYRVFWRGGWCFFNRNRQSFKICFNWKRKTNLKSYTSQSEETLNIGRVKTYGPYSRYLVDDEQGIIVLTSLFNGNLVLGKRKSQVKKWLDILNILELNHNTLPILSNSWLSGFIDAEGCFFHFFTSLCEKWEKWEVR